MPTIYSQTYFVFLFIMYGLLSACGAGGNASNVDKTITLDDFIWPPVAGNATAPFNSAFPFLQFIPTLDLTQLKTASQGREFFIGRWTAAPGPRTLFDGLGPLSIASACADCHLSAGRAASLQANGQIGVGLLFRLGDTQGNLDPYYGGQLQTAATIGLSEGQVSWSFNDSDQPIFTLLTHGPALAQGIHLGPRLSPQLVGIGLLDLVPPEEILNLEDPDDQNADGISGRAHWLEVEGQLMLGRFGWKAMQPTLRHQSAGAMQQDMGLTTSINPTEPCTMQQTVCAEQPNGGTPEVSDNTLAAVNDFLTLLAVPERRVQNAQQFNQGADIFESIGCAHCHQPTLTTGQSKKYPLLSHQLIYAYTDLLLHDLGEALSDNVREGDADPSEWRTPPLWGLGLVEAVPGSRFLHDGRAQTLEQAILWHGGEALQSQQKFKALTAAQQHILLAFLRAI
ncbi:di-heme oxidoredictase family protein [Marinagarivorans algicola]|uniref:di-heme oxidoredictase family protein n=1 Tax=Marinagarivorans algicola TaxID=1513270 RepID=UPI0012E23E90|nr:di-heme oxidoredictase family protein [Marinagarivorans algicola]